MNAGGLFICAAKNYGEALECKIKPNYSKFDGSVFSIKEFEKGFIFYPKV